MIRVRELEGKLRLIDRFIGIRIGGWMMKQYAILRVTSKNLSWVKKQRALVSQLQYCVDGCLHTIFIGKRLHQRANVQSNGCGHELWLKNPVMADHINSRGVTVGTMLLNHGDSTDMTQGVLWYGLRCRYPLSKTVTK